MNEEKLYLYKLGCDGYISKPYIKYDLFKEIGRVMNGILLLK